MAVIALFSNFRTIFSVTGTIGVDGYPAWPLASVRASGFTSFGLPKPIVHLPFTVTANPASAGAVIGNDDAIIGVDDYDWYVSQGTDVAAKQRLVVTQYSAAKSGTIQITGQKSVYDQIIPKASALQPPEVPLPEETALLMFKHVTIYVQKKSNNAIQVIHLYRDSFSKSGP